MAAEESVENLSGSSVLWWTIFGIVFLALAIFLYVWDPINLVTAPNKGVAYAISSAIAAFVIVFMLQKTLASGVKEKKPLQACPQCAQLDFKGGKCGCGYEGAPISFDYLAEYLTFRKTLLRE